MAKKNVEPGWRERCGLEKRRCKPKPKLEQECKYISPDQLPLWENLAEIFQKPVDKLGLL